MYVWLLFIVYIIWFTVFGPPINSNRRYLSSPLLSDLHLIPRALSANHDYFPCDQWDQHGKQEEQPRLNPLFKLLQNFYIHSSRRNAEEEEEEVGFCVYSTMLHPCPFNHVEYIWYYILHIILYIPVWKYTIIYIICMTAVVHHPWNFVRVRRFWMNRAGCYSWYSARLRLIGRGRGRSC